MEANDAKKALSKLNRYQGERVDREVTDMVRKDAALDSLVTVRNRLRGGELRPDVLVDLGAAGKYRSDFTTKKEWGGKPLKYGTLSKEGYSALLPDSSIGLFYTASTSIP